MGDGFYTCANENCQNRLLEGEQEYCKYHSKEEQEKNPGGNVRIIKFLFGVWLLFHALRWFYRT